jgi:hypothetical protein
MDRLARRQAARAELQLTMLAAAAWPPGGVTRVAVGCQSALAVGHERPGALILMRRENRDDDLQQGAIRVWIAQ